ncbi:MAG: hypothetical protein R3C05_04000 [Pirellulaceae bacterium]
MNLVSRFLAIACICNASISLGQQMMYQEQPYETYPTVGQGYADDGSYVDGSYVDGDYCFDGSCDTGCAKEPGCCASFLDACATVGGHNLAITRRPHRHVSTTIPTA